MDRENVVHVHNGVLLSGKNKQWNLEIHSKIDGTRRDHFERRNPITERQTWYVLTHIWILDIEQRITNPQSTLPEKLGSKEDSKRDIHGPPEKGKGTRSPEKIGSMGGLKRELGQ